MGRAPLAGSSPDRPDVSWVVVTYHSSGWCSGLIASLRREAARAGASIEVVIVDHSEEAAEADRLRELGPTHLLTRSNRGFAAGVNAGLALAKGRFVAVANPDIELHPGALAALLGALDAGWDVVGPQFELGGFLFPPADEQTPSEHLRRHLAARSPMAWRRRLGHELASCRAVWEAVEPVAAPVLSGACLLFRSALAEQIGSWDEGYFLYFEEIDWLRRVRREGGRLALVPRALVRHEWGHAAEPGAAMPHFRESRRRFVSRHHPVLGRLVSALKPGTVPLEVAQVPTACPDWKSRWWLLSPTALGLPAAGFAGTWSELTDALVRLAAEQPRPWSYLLIGADPGGAVLGPWHWRVGRE